MAFISPYLLVDIFLALSLGIYIYFKWSFGYWKRKGLFYIEPTFPWGTQEVGNPFRRKLTVGLIMKSLYDQIKAANQRLGGIFIFSRPLCILTDPELIKSVMSTDFDYFNDRGFYHNEKVDPLSAHIFNLSGTKWKNLRAKISPTFTSGKIKSMFPALMECSVPLQESISRCVQLGEAIDIKEQLACYTTDVIGSCAFGLDCASFKDADAPFRKYGRKVFSGSFRTFARALFTFAFPALAAKFGVRLFPPEVGDFYLKVVKDMVQHREANKIVRNDFLQLLMDIRTDGEGLTIEQIAAQCFIFFLGGFETSSGTMSWSLYELSVNPEIQERARKEIKDVLAKHENQFTYEAVQEMKYLEQIVDETLRKYPVIPQLHRKCTMDYTVPGTQSVLTKGDRVTVSVVGLHYDPDYFPNPDLFDPERFSDQNKRTIRPFTYLPFGDGPRFCIGNRFGLLQSKLGLAVLLNSFRFSLHGKTQVPVTFNTKSVILNAQGGLWLKAVKI